MLENHGITRNTFNKMPLRGKLLFIIFTSPVIILIAILASYVTGPLQVIIIASANVYPKLFDKSWIKRLKFGTMSIKAGEAVFESLWQCKLAMVFYSNNRNYYDSPHPTIPWITKGAVFVISIHLSVYQLSWQ